MESNKMYRSNYDLMVEQVKKLFLEYDQQMMIDKFNLKYDEKFLYIAFLKQVYRIDRRTGTVTYGAIGKEKPAGYNEVMSIYDMLSYSGDRPVTLSGQWESMGNLSGIKGGTHKEGSVLNGVADFFAGKTTELAEACMELGGVPEKKGDVGYILPVFDFFPVYFQFWDAYEEFPAQISFFLDKNARQFVHYETIWFMLSFVTEKLKDKVSSSAHRSSLGEL